MQIGNLEPTVLRCGYFNGYEAAGFEMASRICYDYELEFFLNSQGGVVVDGRYYPFNQGEINIRRPGQKVAGTAPYECYVVCIDLAGRRCLPKGYVFGDVLNAQPDYENAFLRELPVKFRPKHGDRILASFKEMLSVLQADSALARFRANTLARVILWEVFDQLQQEKASAQRVNKHISKAVSYINAHYTEDISVGGLVEDLGLSKAYFNRCFKEICGMTPLEMITSLRMEKARLLLSISRAKVSEVAQVCGYGDAVYFTSVFKRLYGITPTAYREEQTAGLP